MKKSENSTILIPPGSGAPSLLKEKVKTHNKIPSQHRHTRGQQNGDANYPHEPNLLKEALEGWEDFKQKQVIRLGAEKLKKVIKE